MIAVIPIIGGEFDDVGKGMKRPRPGRSLRGRSRAARGGWRPGRVDPAPLAGSYAVSLVGVADDDGVRPGEAGHGPVEQGRPDLFFGRLSCGNDIDRIGRDDLRVEPFLDEQPAGHALELEPVVFGRDVERGAHSDDPEDFAGRQDLQRLGRELGGIDDLDVARAFNEEAGQRLRDRVVEDVDAAEV